MGSIWVLFELDLSLMCVPCWFCVCSIRGFMRFYVVSSLVIFGCCLGLIWGFIRLHLALCQFYLAFSLLLVRLDLLSIWCLFGFYAGYICVLFEFHVGFILDSMLDSMLGFVWVLFGFYSGFMLVLFWSYIVYILVLC